MHVLRKYTVIGIMMASVLATSAYAGGSLFGHKAKTVNTNGVHSIGVHICGSLECPPVRIFEGKCDKKHMSMHWGVCVCDKGYVPKDGKCDACPEGQYSDGIHGCKGCPEGKYMVHEGDTECTPCPDGYYCVGGKAYTCPDEYAATCDHTGKSTTCIDGYYLGDTQCVANGKCADGSEPEIKNYQSGECCSITNTVKYCPGDTIPTCTREASCDDDESECTGSYDEKMGGHICCLENRAQCPSNGSDENACVCVPDGAPNTQWKCNDNTCITCKAGEVAKCSDYGCVCGPDKDAVECNYATCITCKAGEVAKCSDYGCVCGPDKDAVECNYATCITCKAGEVAKCSGKGDCVCGPDKDAVGCNEGGSTCIACKAGEVAKCSYYGECTCGPDKDAVGCNEGGSTCIACKAGEVAKCSSEGECACGGKNSSISCSMTACIACNPPEKAVCSEIEGPCTCVPEGKIGKCNMSGCYLCNEGEIFTGYCDMDCPLSCASKASECMDGGCCAHFGGQGDWVDSGADYLCCESGVPAYDEGDGAFCCTSAASSQLCCKAYAKNHNPEIINSECCSDGNNMDTGKASPTCCDPSKLTGYDNLQIIGDRRCADYGELGMRSIDYGFPCN